MRYTVIYCCTLWLACQLIACGTTPAPSSPTAGQPTTRQDSIPMDSIPEPTALLKESYHQEDTAINEHFAERLAPIRAHYKMVNGITQWSKRDYRELEESSEGGDAYYYYQNDQLQKIAAYYFGETGQALTEFYLLNGRLCLVNEKQARYNRPMYYDSAAMKENNDTEAFDADKSTYSLTRSYFDKDSLFHQLNYEDGGAPASDSLLVAEQQRLQQQFESLLQLIPKR